MTADVQREICLVALNAAPAVFPSLPGPIGGIETRAWTLARGLTATQLPIALGVRDERVVQESCLDGVRVFPLNDWMTAWARDVARRTRKSSRFPWLHVEQFAPHLLWRIPLLPVAYRLRNLLRPAVRPDSILLQRNPGALVTFGVQTYAARVLSSARALGIPGCLSISSDDDLQPAYVRGAPGRNVYGDPFDLCARVIELASHIVVQTESQLEKLRDTFGRDGVLIPNPFDFAGWTAHCQPAAAAAQSPVPPYVLWVGRADAVYKRPELALELARRCPELPFRLIMNRYDANLEQRIRDQCPQNVTLVERVPFADMPREFQAARVFLSTSAREGFPNTFLQAAACGVPIVSTNVGEQFLAQCHAGELCGEAPDAAAHVLRTAWQSAAARAAQIDRRKLEQTYGLPEIATRWADLLRVAMAEDTD